MIKIGLLVIATNKYIEFAKSLYCSMQQFFLNDPEIERTMFLFTNQTGFSGPIRIQQEHEPWPKMTLQRYEIFMNNSTLLREMDYLYYCDADMLFVDHITREILGEYVATLHPGFWNSSRDNLPYETNRLSKAYIAPHEGVAYYAGGFNGGKTEKFLKMAQIISRNIRSDLKKGYIAVWHDESHLNRYFIDHQPTVVLNPSYCFPEAEWARNLPFPKIILALEKNHNELRS